MANDGITEECSKTNRIQGSSLPLACVCCAAVVADALAVEACVWTIGGADVDPAPAEADVDAAADVVDGDAVLVDIIGCALELPAELAVT